MVKWKTLLYLFCLPMKLCGEQMRNVKRHDRDCREVAETNLVRERWCRC